MCVLRVCLPLFCLPGLVDYVSGWTRYFVNMFVISYVDILIGFFSRFYIFIYVYFRSEQNFE